jgi:tyrosyl-tRNA synthetase
MSKSLGNYVGVTEEPAVMYAKLLSVSDALMWRYYDLLTDLSEAALAEEKERGAPFASKMALARRIVADFHGSDAAADAEAEWRRVHQQRQAPTDLPVKVIAPGSYKVHELLAGHGLASSRSEAVRLLRQGAVRRDGVVVDGKAALEGTAGESFVLSVGPARFVRFDVR